jgi:intraflagellar transport protein 172
LYAERGDWDRALETAAEHGNDVLHKYVALCATQRIREGKASDALQVIPLLTLRNAMNKLWF